jgi:hypothetical protein
MKKIVLSICLFTASVFAFAQSRIERADYLKVSRDAVIADFQFAEKTVTKTVEDKMEKLGYKGKSTKGYTLYSGVKLTELGNGVFDLYFMIDKKSRRDKDNAQLTMLVSKGYENFVSTADDTTGTFNKAKTFVDNLKNSIEAYDLELQVTAQDDILKKNEKKASNLRDDADDLQKKLKKVQQQIEENKTDQAKQEKEVVVQKQILDTLKSKRKQQ